MKFANIINILHVTKWNRKGFQGQKSKMKVMTTPNVDKNPLFGSFAQSHSQLQICIAPFTVMESSAENSKVFKIQKLPFD